MTHQKGLARKLMAAIFFANSWSTIYKYNHVYYVEIFGNQKGGCIKIVTKMKIPRWSQGPGLFETSDMKWLTIKFIVLCALFVIANINYVKT